MKPILFNTEMVRAILAERKTETRRFIRFKPGMTGRLPVCGARDYLCYPGGIKYPPYKPGDILYVRETWAVWPRYGAAPKVYYKAPGDTEWSQTPGIGKLYYRADGDAPDGVKWRPSIHMPKSAARIFLRVTDVRAERLQDITELQILEKEGIKVDFPQPKPSYTSLAYVETRLKPEVKRAFSKVWNSTIKKADLDKYGWDANPWVWATAFERISKEEAEAA